MHTSASLPPVSAAPYYRAGGSDTVGEDGVIERWRDLASLHARIDDALDRALGGRHGLTVSQFEVLERLLRSPERKRRIQELAEEAHLSQSALSRLVARLEAEGLVSRAICDHDRRGIWACLTEDGERRYAEAAPTRRAVLDDFLGEPAPD
jgi:DNA-binding MarR family transcriptional regulator